MDEVGGAKICQKIRAVLEKGVFLYTILGDGMGQWQNICAPLSLNKAHAVLQCALLFLGFFFSSQEEGQSNSNCNATRLGNGNLGLC